MLPWSPWSPPPPIIALLLLLRLLGTPRPVASRQHHLFVGNMNMPAAMHSLAFDDESFQINVSRTVAADSSHSWITFNVRLVEAPP